MNAKKIKTVKIKFREWENGDEQTLVYLPFILKSAMILIRPNF